MSYSDNYKVLWLMFGCQSHLFFAGLLVLTTLLVSNLCKFSIHYARLLQDKHVLRGTYSMATWFCRRNVLPKYFP